MMLTLWLALIDSGQHNVNVLPDDKNKEDIFRIESDYILYTIK